MFSSPSLPAKGRPADVRNLSLSFFRPRPERLYAAEEPWQPRSITPSLMTARTLSSRRQMLSVAVDVLMALSAEGEDLARMEPFLRLVSHSPEHITGSVATKCGKFVQRMLGAARTEPAKLRTLQFASAIDSRIVFEYAKKQIEELAESTGSGVSSPAKELIQKYA